uniref:Transmembrane protein n=1 Tax=viral metagenome TaxID=1070528 RepID=A0A6C0BMF2_9ZZZZ
MTYMDHTQEEEQERDITLAYIICSLVLWIPSLITITTVYFTTKFRGYALLGLFIPLIPTGLSSLCGSFLGLLISLGRTRTSLNQGGKTIVIASLHLIVLIGLIFLGMYLRHE